MSTDLSYRICFNYTGRDSGGGATAAKEPRGKYLDLAERAELFKRVYGALVPGGVAAFGDMMFSRTRRPALRSWPLSAPPARRSSPKV